MELLVKVIEKVALDYLDDIVLILEKESLTLEYYYEKDREKDVFKTLQVREFGKNKLSVTFLEANKFNRQNTTNNNEQKGITKITDLEGLEDIFLILKKLSKAITHTDTEIQEIKSIYTNGTKIKLNRMYDYIEEVPSGTIGIVTNVDDIGQIHVNWENGSTLALNIDVDDFEIIEE